MDPASHYVPMAEKAGGSIFESGDGKSGGRTGGSTSIDLLLPTCAGAEPEPFIDRMSPGSPTGLRSNTTHGYESDIAPQPAILLAGAVQ